MVFTTIDTSLTPIAAMGYQNIPNILDNGGCEIFQRGTSNNPIEGQYTVADRWKVTSFNGTGTFTASKETGAGNFDSGTSSLKLNLTATGSATLFDLGNYVENFASYRGKTISVYARVKSNVATVLRISDGISVTTIATHTGSGNFETLQGTFVVSSIASELQVLFRNSASAIFTTYVDSVMLVLGSTPVPFVPTNPQVDLARCQRYFWRVGQANGVALVGTVYGLGHATSSTSAYGYLYPPVTMRVAPTVTFVSPTLMQLHNAAGGNISTTAVISSYQAPGVVVWTATVSSGLVAGNVTALETQNASAAPIDVSADL